MQIKVVIIDDEPLARKGLKEYVADVDFLQLAGEYDHPLKAVDLISSGEVQLLLLDIEMPKITGIEFFRSLKNAPPVIFTTAYPQYALDGFELNALDYLVKPISFDRFLKAALKAKEYYELRQQNRVANTSQTDFYIKADNQFVRIAFNDVQFVEALQNYVCIYTAEKKYISYLTMKSVEEYLPAAQFVKTHKSFIVNAAKIDAIEGNEIRIASHRIPISRSEKEEVLELLLKNKFLKR
ncbi:MAG: response regulator transcription factor [Chitinophagaceae bacterium]|nr:response regulator transcription factor [Chitinophagaceae bacterium]